MSASLFCYCNRSKGGPSRLAKMRKPQCTSVHEDFRIKRNAESALFSHCQYQFSGLDQYRSNSTYPEVGYRGKPVDKSAQVTSLT